MSVLLTTALYSGRRKTWWIWPLFRPSTIARDKTAVKRRLQYLTPIQERCMHASIKWPTHCHAVSGSNPEFGGDAPICDCRRSSLEENMFVHNALQSIPALIGNSNH